MLVDFFIMKSIILTKTEYKICNMRCPEDWDLENH